MKSKGSSRKTQPTTKPKHFALRSQVSAAESLPFPIVGVGASAGGLEAFTDLVSYLPSNPGMALVLIHHIDPRRQTSLTELVSRATKMPVVKVAGEVPVKRDHIYVSPPNAEMIVAGPMLRVTAETHGRYPSIDRFLYSLADAEKNRAIGVILSGSGSEGSRGLRAVKARGGITLAQEPKSAKYDGMARNAVAAGCVDLVLPPHDIAAELTRIAAHPYVIPPQSFQAGEPPGESNLHQALLLVQRAFGVDFTRYQRTTISRRVARRMLLRRLDSLADYVKYLQQNSAEVKALYEDILIQVTAFFGNPATFQAVAEKVFPRLMENRAPDVPIRIWVPGCSTGEEVYSIALSLLEFLGDRAVSTPIQIFGTDVNEAAVEKARAATYLEDIKGEVSAERLKRFFVKVDGGYRIKKDVREMCFFARQDVTSDPPFSRLDLISCRNLLIFMGSPLQKKVVQTFHYALKPGGFLILGNSESVSRFSTLFTTEDKLCKIYSRKPGAARVVLGSSPGSVKVDLVAMRTPRKEPSGAFDPRREADHITLSSYAPAGVLVNEELEVLQFRGRTGFYLEPSPGEASLQLLKMARQELLFELRAAINEAKKLGTPVKRPSVRVKTNGQSRKVSVEVVPIRASSSSAQHFLVLFHDVKPVLEPEDQGAGSETPRPRKGKLKRVAVDPRVTELQQGLAVTRKYLQSIFEEQEATNEKLKFANQEALSINEELLTTSEELETAKEELQCGDQELVTLNEELDHRNAELGQLSNDLNNLLSRSGVSILMLSTDLRIRRFSPLAGQMLNLIPTDIGRPVTDIDIKLGVPDLQKLMLTVVHGGGSHHQEVRDANGNWYAMELRPYVTLEGKTEGAVMVLLDIAEVKRSQREAQEARAYAEAIVETVKECLVIMDADLRVQTANRSFFETFRFSPQDAENKLLYQLGSGEWNTPELRELLEQVLANNGPRVGFRLDQDFPLIGPRTMLLNARRVEGAGAGKPLILLSIEDITERNKKEESLRQLSDRLFRVQDEERQRIARELHDATSTNLVALAMQLSSVEPAAMALDPQARRSLSDALALAKQCSREIRTASYLLHPPLMHDQGLAPALRLYLEGFMERSGVRVELDVPADLGPLPREVEAAAFRLVQEALSNVHRHSGTSAARVQISREVKGLNLEVRDEGRGMPPGVLGATATSQLGLGLTAMHERVRALEGRLEITSGQKGTTVKAVLPAGDPT
jgi:two-component system, chemotaxis family, CheB/CheR fusion protein